MSSEESDIQVSLFFHNMPASLLREFAQRIVKPYFDGNMNAAIRQLMNKALIEEELLQAHVRRVQL